MPTALNKASLLVLHIVLIVVLRTSKLTMCSPGSFPTKLCLSLIQFFKDASSPRKMNWSSFYGSHLASKNVRSSIVHKKKKRSPKNLLKLFLYIGYARRRVYLIYNSALTNRLSLIEGKLTNYDLLELKEISQTLQNATYQLVNRNAAI